MQEKSLAAAHPEKMLQAYKLSWKAESICSELYLTSQTNDESDACRHFTWAALLTKNLGRDFAEKVLDAHEQEPNQLEEQKAMDMANNRRGISIAEKMIEKTMFSEQELINYFKKELKAGHLSVLSPSTN